ncbi:MAG: hypothetical protein J6B24_08080, partial [Clostridia bacterium]|nr:hypothetical protein [Clostridia bacterium]
LCARLHRIAREEGIDLSDEAARLIARQAQGGMRDAVSLLELCAGARLPITPELVTRTIGTTGREGTCRVVNAIADKNFDLLFEIIDDMVSASRDPAVFWQELIGYYRDMLVTKTVKDPSKYLDLTDSEREALVAIAARFTKETLLFHIGLLEDALFAMQKSYAVKRTVCEITLVRLCDPALDTSVESILTRLSRIEEQLVAGIPAAAPVETVTPTANTAPKATAPAAEEFPPLDEPPLPDMPPDLWEPPLDYGMTEPTPPPVRREAPTPKPAPAQRTETPTARPAEKKTAPAQAAQPAPVPALTSAPATQRVLRPLRSWTEAVDRVKATSRMAASFLISAKAYTTEDGKIVVKLDSDFARGMVSREGAPEALRAALSVCLGHKLETADILYEVEDNRVKAQGSLIDLIIEAAEE